MIINRRLKIIFADKPIKNFKNDKLKNFKKILQKK